MCKNIGSCPVLEGGGRVGESEEYDSGFKQPSVGPEGCFPLVAIFDAYIVVPPSNVKLGEVLGAS